MPLNMQPKDVTASLSGFDSVLIVSCPVCPAMCFAMNTGTPMSEPLKHGLETAAFEDYVRSIRAPLERRGVRTEVFSVHTPTPMMCIWTERQRSRLRKRAAGYDAVLVLGCRSATTTVEDTLRETGARIVQGMEADGTVNARARIRFPLIVELERRGDRPF